MRVAAFCPSRCKLRVETFPSFPLAVSIREMSGQNYGGEDEDSLGGLAGLSLLALLLATASAQAATDTAPKKIATPAYDAGKEITLEGNISSVNKTVPGKLMGGHVFVATSKGTIDGHLGPFALNGTHSVALSAGQHIKMVGVLTTVRGSQVFLVRSIDTGGTTYTIRNEHGFPVLQGAQQPTKNITFVTQGGTR